MTPILRGEFHKQIEPVIRDGTGAVLEVGCADGSTPFLFSYFVQYGFG